MNIQTWNIDKLRNWDKNPRAIKKEDFERLKKQISELKEYKPLLITPDGEVLGGNMRLRAYKELGLTDVTVSIVKPKNEAEKVKYALSDNDRAGYYVEQDLAELVQEYGLDINLEDYHIDLDKDISLSDLLNQFAPDVEEDEAPAIAEGEPISKLGEIYQLGKHRLMCGDSTKIEDVEKLMNGAKADMVFTDPPYGVSLETTIGGSNDSYTELENDDLNPEKLIEFNRDWITNAYQVVKDWGVCYIFYSSNKVIEIRTVASELFKIKDTLIWVKDNFVLGRNDYKPQYEPILYLEKLGNGKVDRTWNGKFDQSNIWTISRNKSLKEHPTQKPIELCAKAINNSSKPDDIVLDLFGGSGSTLIACEQTNRICYMMEIDPKYCDVIRKRYENYMANKQAGAGNG